MQSRAAKTVCSGDASVPRAGAWPLFRRLPDFHPSSSRLLSQFEHALGTFSFIRRTKLPFADNLSLHSARSSFYGDISTLFFTLGFDWSLHFPRMSILFFFSSEYQTTFRLPTTLRRTFPVKLIVYSWIYTLISFLGYLLWIFATFVLEVSSIQQYVAWFWCFWFQKGAPGLSILYCNMGILTLSVLHVWIWLIYYQLLCFWR